MLLDALPSAPLYEKSYMHRDRVTHTLVCPVTEFLVTARSVAPMCLVDMMSSAMMLWCAWQRGRPFEVLEEDEGGHRVCQALQGAPRYVRVCRIPHAVCTPHECECVCWVCAGAIIGIDVSADGRRLCSIGDDFVRYPSSLWHMPAGTGLDYVHATCRR